MSDPLSSTAEGFANALLDWSEEKIGTLVKKFQSKELAFIEDPKNVDIVKKQRSSPEYILMSPFLPKGYSVLIQMGLALRQLEIQKDYDAIQTLRKNIMARHVVAGLRVAELTQNGIVRQLVSRLAAINKNPADVQRKLGSFLDQVEFLTIFVQARHGGQVAEQCQLAKSRVDTNPSHMVIIFGAMSAKSLVYEVLDEIRKDPRNFAIETEDDGVHVTAFVFAPEVKARLTSWVDALTEEEEDGNASA